jgi:enterochelin esterase-like enzyme
LRVIRRLAAAGLLLFAACSADRAPSSSAPTRASTLTASSSGATTRSTTEGTCATAGDITRITIQSDVLSTPVRVSVVAPSTAERSDRVLYLLHGANTDETQWEAIGVQAALDAVVASGQTRPFTVVLPDLPNSYDPAIDAPAFFDDVVPAVERCLGGPRSAAHRAVGGISRGGSLALEVAAFHGDAFAAVGGHSPAVADIELTSLARQLASNRTHVWLDVGTGDSLRPATEQLATALTDAGSTPELLVSSGGHDRAYWGAHLHDYLEWYGRAISS